MERKLEGTEGTEGMYANLSHIQELMRKAAQMGDIKEVKKLQNAWLKEMQYYIEKGVSPKEITSNKLERWRIHGEPNNQAQDKD